MMMRALVILVSVLCLHEVQGSGISESPKPVRMDMQIDGHPRLLLDATEIPRMKKFIRKDPILLRLHEYIIGFADETLSEPVNERTMRGHRLLGISADNLTRIFYCAYAYRMTGDERYARRAADEMLASAAFDDWAPGHFLGTAEMTFALAIGYDWCYPALSDGEKAIVRDAIITKGLEQGLKEQYNKRWVGKFSNWNQVCNTCLLMGALAVEDHAPQFAEAYLNMAVEDPGGISVPMEDYSPDGAYPEGPGYWNYGTGYNVIFLAQCEKRYGTDFGLLEKHPGFLKTMDYANAMITPTMENYCYSDHAFKAQIGIVPFWFYARTGDPSYLWQQEKILAGKDGITLFSSRHRRLLPAAIVFGTAARKPAKKVTEPQWLAYVGDGKTPVAAFRSGWNSPDDIYLGFKLGTPWISHGHMDIGSFYMEADGVRWAAEMGGESYERMEKETKQFWKFHQESDRWKILRLSNRGHNVLIFDDAQQLADQRADMGKFSHDENMMYASSDLSSIYSASVESVHRRVSLADKRYAVIHDRVVTGDKATVMRWNMCTEADSFTHMGGNRYQLGKGGKTLHMIIESGCPVTAASWSAEPPNPAESPNTGKQFVGFEANLETGREYEFKVYLIPGSASTEPAIGMIL